MAAFRTLQRGSDSSGGLGTLLCGQAQRKCQIATSSDVASNKDMVDEYVDSTVNIPLPATPTNQQTSNGCHIVSDQAVSRDGRPSDISTRASETSDTPRKNDSFDCGRTVAIFADYDGCFDIISPSNQQEANQMLDYADQTGRLKNSKQHAQDLLKNCLRDITTGAENVVLFSGSDRVSSKVDDFSAAMNGNGLAMAGLRALAEEKGWKFNPNLLEDAGLSAGKYTPPGLGRFTTHDAKLDDRHPGIHHQPGSMEIKRLLVESNFKHLTGLSEVYFFDDVQSNLEYTRDKACIPDHIEFKTVWFDWHAICIDGTQHAPLEVCSS